MPNWCGNYIIISGEESNMKPIYDLFREGEEKIVKYNEQIQEFRKNNPDENPYDAIKMDDTWVMSTLVPEDEDFEQIKESGEYILSPYVSFYGCKWDFTVNDCNGEYQPDLITISPQTAWSPPLAFCQRLSEKYKVNVAAEYYESGNDMGGRFEYSDGEEVEGADYTYAEALFHLDNETFWVEVESDLEWLLCENPEVTIEDIIGTKYPFLTDKEDIESLTEIYNESKQEDADTAE